MENKMMTNSAEVENSAKLNAQIVSLWTLKIIEDGKREVFDTVGKKEDILNLLNELTEKYDNCEPFEKLYEGDVLKFEIEYNDEVHSFFIRISSMYESYEKTDYYRAVNDLNDYLEYYY
jgi:hypothetical protein